MTQALSELIDQQFGFRSKWTFEERGGCWELNGEINIDSA
jgi:hypothetical protein